MWSGHTDSTRNWKVWVLTTVSCYHFSTHKNAGAFGFPGQLVTTNSQPFFLLHATPLQSLIVPADRRSFLEFADSMVQLYENEVKITAIVLSYCSIFINEEAQLVRCLDIFGRFIGTGIYDRIYLFSETSQRSWSGGAWFDRVLIWTSRGCRTIDAPSATDIFDIANHNSNTPVVLYIQSWLCAHPHSRDLGASYFLDGEKTLETAVVADPLRLSASGATGTGLRVPANAPSPLPLTVAKAVETTAKHKRFEPASSTRVLPLNYGYLFYEGVDHLRAPADAPRNAPPSQPNSLINSQNTTQQDLTLPETFPKDWFMTYEEAHQYEPPAWATYIHDGPSVDAGGSARIPPRPTALPTSSAATRILAKSAWSHTVDLSRTIGPAPGAYHLAAAASTPNRSQMRTEDWSQIVFV